MSYAEASNVPSDTVPWVIARKGAVFSGTVHARLWHEARDLAMKAFVCGPDEVIVERTTVRFPSPAIEPRKLSPKT